MTPLRQRMIQDIQLRGLADRTAEAYTRPVRQLAQCYHASPDRLTEEQVRNYLIHLSTVRKVARGTHTIAPASARGPSRAQAARRSFPCPEQLAVGREVVEELEVGVAVHPGAVL